MKVMTLVLTLSLLSVPGWGQGGDTGITQTYETNNAVIYRMKTENWLLCNVLHGAVIHDQKGYYCLVEKHSPNDAGGGDGLTLLSTGNVDRLHYSEVQVVNPDPAGAPLTVPIIGVELHFMDMGPGFWPIDLRIYFPLMPNNARNVENCVEWFTKTQNREVALNINHQPGWWDGTKSPWPYFQVAIKPGTQQIHTWTVDGAEIWLWDANDVQCWLADDNLAPYWQNPDGVQPRKGLPKLLANPKWHILVAWDGRYAAAK